MEAVRCIRCYYPRPAHSPRRPIGGNRRAVASINQALRKRTDAVATMRAIDGYFARKWSGEASDEE
jgi:hypothetical protein